jgi:2,4-dienoyl-CoA reductase-like NADH-dependent reductase (Old Yellow Enzyme family)
MSPQPASRETIPQPASRETIELLFEPIAIGGAMARNRIALAPMTSCFAEVDGKVSDRLISFLEARAKGGAGLVMTEGAAVEARGRGWTNHLCVYDDTFRPGLARLAGAIRAHGALAWMQLMHNGRRTVSAATGVQPISSTSQRSPGVSWEVPHRLSTAEVHDVIGLFVAAIRRAAETGFDGVELHGGHAYLINQFLSPSKNDRDDEFGGDPAGRARFATEIIRRAHAELGDDFPIGVRLSIVEFEPGGITLQDTLGMVTILEAAGAAYIDGSAGVSTLTKELKWTTGEGEATLSEYAVQVRNQLTRIPYMTVGRVLRPATAERLLRDGVADIIGIGRAMVSDPEWPNKARSGEPFMMCIGCNGCQQRSVHRQSGCPVNVSVGHEYEYQQIRAARPSRVLVIGSGVGGLACALAAADRGHATAIADGEFPFGGLLGLRARVPFNEEIVESLEMFAVQLADAGVTTLAPGDPAGGLGAQIAAWEPDVIVDATPGEPLRTVVPWRAYDLERVMSGRVGATELGQTVGVIGSSYAAVEAALRLASDGYDVTVLGDARAFAKDTHPQLAYRAVERLEKAGGRLLPSVSYLDLVARARSVLASAEPFRPRVDNAVHLDFDSVVQGIGWSNVPRDLHVDDLFRGRANYYVGDTYNPWEQRFVAERGAEFGLRV